MSEEPKKKSRKSRKRNKSYNRGDLASYFDPDLFDRKLKVIYDRCHTSFTFEEVQAVFHTFFYWHQIYRGSTHKDIHGDSIERIINAMDRAPFRSRDGIELEPIELDCDDYLQPDGVIQRYFETPFKTNSYTIQHFFAGVIRGNMFMYPPVKTGRKQVEK